MSTTASSIEYVSPEDTIADVGQNVATSASLRTTVSIFLSILIVFSYVLNITLLTTVLFWEKLRSRTLYMLFGYLALINIFDLTFTVLFSILYVANGTWTFGDTMCRVTAMIQAFCEQYTLFTLMVMAVERTVALATSRLPLFTMPRTGCYLLALAAISLSLTIPILTPAIPVKQYNFRSLCAVDNGSPIAYSATNAVLFCGCLIVFLICSAAILKKKDNRNLPQEAAEYSQFIIKSREIHDHISHGKLVLMVTAAFLLLEGPYICLCYVVQIRNSAELLENLKPMDIPQEAETLITWLKYIFNLLAPVIIFCWCNDIWIKAKEIFCCRSYDPPTIGQFYQPKGNAFVGGGANVMTLVATPQGLELKVTALDGTTQSHDAGSPIGRPSQGVIPIAVNQPYNSPTTRFQRNLQVMPTPSNIPVLPPNYVETEEPDPPPKRTFKSARKRNTGTSRSATETSSETSSAIKATAKRNIPRKNGTKPSRLPRRKPPNTVR